MPHPAGDGRLISAKSGRTRLRLEVSPRRFLVYWHFWIGLLVSPFLLVIGITGLLYLFKPEIESRLYRRILADATAEQSLDRSQLFRDRLKSRYLQRMITEASIIPGSPSRVARIELENDACRAPLVFLADQGRPWPQQRIYVDPEQTAPQKIRGSLPEGGFFSKVNDVHRTLGVGLFGRLIVEFVVGWTMTSMVLGLLLWQHTKRDAPTRLAWVRWRNAHAWGGSCIVAVILVIGWTGLQFSEIYGTLYHGIARWTGQYDYLLDKPKSVAPPGRYINVPIDDVVLGALDHGMSWQRIAIQMPTTDSDCIMIESGAGFPPSWTQTLYLNQWDGSLVRRHDLRDLGPLAQWNKWSYPLHVGSIGGWFSKVLWAVAVIGLCSMPLSATAMYWSRYRRGHGSLPRRSFPEGKAWWIGMLVMGILLPMVGISMIAIAIGIWLRPVPQPAATHSPQPNPFAPPEAKQPSEP